MIFDALFNWFKSKTNISVAKRLYAHAVRASRQEIFFLKYGVADSVDGRFDLISLHVFLIQKRLLAIGNDTRELSQEIANIMWTDMDDGIREIGVGDLSVPKHLKRMIGAFQGRVRAYSDAIEESEDALAYALWRNVYREEEDKRGHSKQLAAYANTILTTLMETQADRVMNGEINLPSARSHTET